MYLLPSKRKKDTTDYHKMTMRYDTSEEYQ